MTRGLTDQERGQELEALGCVREARDQLLEAEQILLRLGRPEHVELAGDLMCEAHDLQIIADDLKRGGLKATEDRR